MTPSCATPTHTIAISHVIEITEGARDQGVDVRRLLRRAGISPSLLETPLSRVSQEQYARLLSLLGRTLRDEYFGLCSQPVRLGAFAHICRELIDCGTLGEAMRKGFSFYHLMLDDFVARLTVQRGVARVMIHQGSPDPLAAHYARRTFMFFSWGLASWLVARRLPLRAVHYQQPGPGSGTDPYVMFQAPVFYDQPRFGYEFDARWLDLPVVQNRLSVEEFFQQAPANLLVRYRDETSVTERIRRLLRKHLDSGLPTLEQVGDTLGMTPQTLRRRLRAEGQTYQGLKDRLRRDAAIEYLSNPELQLQDVAFRLGFSELSTFHRAFKKWTGLPPGEYRYTHLSYTHLKTRAHRGQIVEFGQSI